MNINVATAAAVDVADAVAVIGSGRVLAYANTHIRTKWHLSIRGAIYLILRSNAADGGGDMSRATAFRRLLVFIRRKAARLKSHIRVVSNGESRAN